MTQQKTVLFGVIGCLFLAIFCVIVSMFVTDSPHKEVIGVPQRSASGQIEPSNVQPLQDRLAPTRNDAQQDSLARPKNELRANEDRQGYSRSKHVTRRRRQPNNRAEKTGPTKEQEAQSASGRDSNGGRPHGWEPKSQR